MAKLIGGLPNQVPTNGDLGTMAFQDYDVVAPQFLAGGRRNLIINGAMQVAQRGTSFASLSNGGSTYTLDRWAWLEGGTPTSVFTVSQDSDAPDGFASSLKTQCTTSGAGHTTLVVRTKFEGQDLQHLAYGTSNAKNAVVSFWVKSNQTGTAVARCYQMTSGRNYAGTYTINSADTWEYKTVLISADASGSIDNDNSEEMSFEFVLAATSTYTSGTPNTWAAYADANRCAGQTIDITTSTSNYISITGVQLEVGSVATPFEHRSFGEELALCQRYYYAFPSSIHCDMKASGSTTGRAAANGFFPVIMRTAPSISFTDGAGNSSRVTYHGGNLGNGANHNHTVYYAYAEPHRFRIITDSYTGYDFYATNIKVDAEL